MYSELLDTIESIVWNSMELIRDVWSSPWIDR